MAQRIRHAIAWVIGLFGLVALASQAAADDSRLAIVGGTIIPMNEDRVIADGTILIEDGTIVAVGPSKSINVPGGYDVIDATGKWITPGLIDTNAHLILTTIPEFFVKYEDRLDEIALQSAQVALKYGLTTIGDTWGPVDTLLKTRNRINSGEAVGTRVLVGGNIIGSGGPFTHYFMTGWDVRGTDLRYGGWVHPDIQARINARWETGVGPNLLAMTPDEIRLAMREYIAKGVDFIKIGVSGHALGAVEPLVFSQEQLEAIRDEAVAAGIPYLSHTFTNASLDAALEIETNFLVHPNVMSVPYANASPAQQQATRDLIAQVIEQDAIAGLMAIPNKQQIDIIANWDPAEHPEEFMINKIMNERQIFMTEANYQRAVDSLKVWLDAGVKYTIATDAGPEAADLGPTIWLRLGRAHFERMEAFQQLGERPHDVLEAATINGARAYGWDDRLGTVEAGKIADLVIVSADPLEDIGNLRLIAMVIKEGQLVDRAALPTDPVLDSDPEAEWPF